MRGLPILLGGFAVAAFLASDVYADGIAVAIGAPAGCTGGAPGCEADISLADARKLADRVSREVRECLRKGAKRKFRLDPEGCRAPAAIDFQRCGDSSATGYGWAYLQDVANGAKVLAMLRSRAKSGRPLAGLGLVLASESPRGEQHIALCSERTINGRAGPPQDCATVAIVTPRLTLIRSGVNSSICLASAHVRLGGATIDFEFEVKTGLAVTGFSQSISSLLKDELGFSVESDIEKGNDGKIYGISIRSTAPLRDSAILEGGWREAIDFDVRLSSEGDGVSVRGSTRPMVCRQASGTLTDYRAPDDSQRQRYATVLNQRVNEAITRACARFQQIDDRTIVCN